MIFQAETRDALLHAINEEYVEAVEVLLENEEEKWKEGDLHVSTSKHREKYPTLKLKYDNGFIVNMLYVVSIAICRAGKQSRQKLPPLLQTLHLWCWQLIETITKSSKFFWTEAEHCLCRTMLGKIVNE